MTAAGDSTARAEIKRQAEIKVDGFMGPPFRLLKIGCGGPRCNALILIPRCTCLGGRRLSRRLYAHHQAPPMPFRRDRDPPWQDELLAEEAVGGVAMDTALEGVAGGGSERPCDLIARHVGSPSGFTRPLYSPCLTLVKGMRRFTGA